MLVGREPEQRAISSLLAGARVGDSRALVLTGEPGIGKSALLAEAERLADRMLVLRAQGIESEQAVPFAALLQLLRPVLPLLDHVPAPQADALSTALLLRGPTGVVEPSRFAVGAATLSLLSRAAEDTPVAVLVDDAHLLDSPSADALVFAARRLVTDPVAVLVTVRSGEPGSELWDTLPTLAVGGLGLDASGELLRAAIGAVAPDRLERLHRATAGNPLGLLELGRQTEPFPGSPPESPVAVSEQLTRSFLGRAGGLSADAATTLLVAAADSTSAATVHQACLRLGLPSARLSEAVDEGLVRLEGDRVVFHHPLVRSAVYGAAPPEERRAVHRAIAAVVPADEADRLAWHLSSGATAPDESTAAVLDTVASASARRGAHALASAAHERAAGLTGDLRLLPVRLAAAGESAWLAGRTEQAVALLGRALEAQPEPRLRSHVHEVRGAVESRTGSLGAARDTLVAAAEAIAESDPDAAIRLFANAVHVAFYMADPRTATWLCREIDRLLASSTDPGTSLLGSMACGMAMVLDGDGAAGIERVRAATYRLVVPGEAPADRFRLPLHVQGALWLRDAGPHRAVLLEAVDLLREEAALGSLPYLLMQIARDGAASDRWDDAEAAYLESIRLARETGQQTDLAASLAGVACLQARKGRGDDCLTNAAAAEELCAASQLRLGSFWVMFARGDLAAGRGDLEEAARHYEALESALAASGLADPDQSCAPELVEVYVHLGRPADAARTTSSFAEKATAKGQAWALARAARARGVCADDGDAGPHFRRALALHAATPDRYETARTELALGSWLRRSRRRTEARPVLRSALDTFAELGARPWADRAEQELRATGETARPRSAPSTAELTPQERQVAQLLARGRTTREAAAALFLSPKTVEYHLRHVYQKLDIRTRAELTGQLLD
ncbi:MAG TPA: AAA family ATPase [Marmoricola sp.]|nr:AAA family ATPase [Marmoricola sp.]